MESHDALMRVAAELRLYDGDPEVLERWRHVCPVLAVAAVARPSEVPGWVRHLKQAGRRNDQDRVLRALVGRAQSGDQAALLAVLACLEPGLRTLERVRPDTLDEVVSEATVRILEFPLARRRAVAAGLILDVRHVFWSAWRKQPETVSITPAEIDRQMEMPPNRLLGVSAAEQVLRLVVDAWRAGQLSTEQARLIIETRVLGEAVGVAARKRAISRMAAYARRDRAEAQMREACVLAA